MTVYIIGDMPLSVASAALPEQAVWVSEANEEHSCQRDEQVPSCGRSVYSMDEKQDKCDWSMKNGGG